MRIRITRKPPLAERHGVIEGREFETCDPPNGCDEAPGETWIVGEDAELVRVLAHEFEEVGDYTHNS